PANSVVPFSTDPDRKRRDDQIRSGPFPHFPDLFYRPDKSPGQVTFLTEFVSNRIQKFFSKRVSFRSTHTSHFVARLDRAIPANADRRVTGRRPRKHARAIDAPCCGPGATGEGMGFRSTRRRFRQSSVGIPPCCGSNSYSCWSDRRCANTRDKTSA